MLNRERFYIHIIGINQLSSLKLQSLRVHVTLTTINHQSIDDEAGRQEAILYLYPLSSSLYSYCQVNSSTIDP